MRRIILVLTVVVFCALIVNITPVAHAQTQNQTQANGLALQPEIPVNEGLLLTLSTSVVGITSSFTGQNITIIGALPYVDPRTLAEGEAYQVVVTVRGPPASPKVRKKKQLAGLWLTYDEEQLVDVPTFAAVLSTDPLQSITDAASLKENRIGLDHILLSDAENSGAKPVPSAPFQQAYLRLNGKKGLYLQNEKGVRQIGPTVFRADIRLPANVPVGSFSASMHVFLNGELVDQKRSFFSVIKTGFERDVTSLASEDPLLYGILAVLCAILAGWMASLIVRS